MTLMRALRGGGDSVQRDHRDDRVVMGMAAVEGPRGHCVLSSFGKCGPPLASPGPCLLHSQGH